MLHRALLFLASLSLWTSHASSTTILPILGPKNFSVAITSLSLIDHNRRDPFANDTRSRSIMLSSFTPIATCQQAQLQPYMPPTTAAFQSNKFATYGLPNGSFQSLFLDTCQAGATHSQCAANALPLVIFSGALGTSRLIYNSMLQGIAAAGYRVISIDHPYDADIVEFPDGSVVTGANISSDADITLALQTRTDDIMFLIRQFGNSSVMEKVFPGSRLREQKNMPRVAVIGHSLGGAAAADAMLQDPSIVAAINIDGTMFGRVLTSSLNRPFMLIGHENKTQATDPSWSTVWPLLKGWKKEIEVRGAAHYSFSDLPLVTAVLGLQDKLPPAVGQVLGTVEGHRMTRLVVTYVTTFLDMALKSGSEDKFAEDGKEFPEVVDVA